MRVDLLDLALQALHVALCEGQCGGTTIEIPLHLINSGAEGMGRLNCAS